MAPLSIPTPAKKGSRRRWLLYAAGAGVLLALIVLISKRKASEGEPSTVTAPANTTESQGGGSAGDQIGSELNSFRAELPGAIQAGVSAAQVPLEGGIAGQFAGVEQKLSGLESQLDTFYGAESPLTGREREEAAYKRGVAKVKANEKARAAKQANQHKPAHKKTGKPAAKHPGQPARTPVKQSHKTTSTYRTTVHTTARHNPSHTGQAAPRPHKTIKKRR